ncbi:hypothetical protein DUNSADRAFT_15911 [Dunaliella salina]|uniref:Uncharacterized protein n=1 Tax=Dunaliella salina TaxID=3046 RepID=A0ABQ7H1E3_DUNSA|nr:hypothetical protein DUNSADRAFT_15911 [Dunaliella salina]|eukprot:KAF5840668.1 hypothetical protein DUNSADRAFT_15911 [Dunaliella salina]
MYRRSSQSTPRLRPSTGSRKTTPLRKRDEERPPWNDTTIGDTDKYKCTPEQLARKKEQRVSKNLVSLRANKHSNSHAPSEWGSGHKLPQHGSPDAQHEGSGSPAPGPSSHKHRDSSTPDSQQRRSETPSSPPINYAAVLQMLNRHREEGLHSPNRFSPGTDAQITSSAPAAAAPAAPAAQQVGAPSPDPRSDYSHVAGLQPEFDATMGGFSRLDISSSSQGAIDGAAAAAAPTPLAAAAAAAAPQPPPPPLVAAAAPESTSAFMPPIPSVNNYIVPPPSRQAENSAQPAPPLSLGAAMDSMWESQQGMGTRLTNLEAALSRQQSYTARFAEVEDLRADVKQLSVEQARMRADLANFSNHATQLMTALQSQLQQLSQLGLGQLQSPPPQQQRHHHHHHQDYQPPLPLRHDVQQQQQQQQYQPPLPQRHDVQQQQQQRQYQPPLPLSHDMQQQQQQQQQRCPPLAVQGLVPHLSTSGGMGSTGSIEHPHPRRSLFTDLPDSAVSPQYSSSHQLAHAAPRVQGTYKACMASPPSRVFSLHLGPHRRVCASNPRGPPESRQQSASEVASTLASIHAPTHPPAMGLAPRIMPSSFQPRALGVPAPSSVGDSGSYLGQGVAGAVAAAGGNLASLGIDLPSHRLGGPALGRTSLEGGSSNTTQALHEGDSNSNLASKTGGAGGIQGLANTFGPSHPEPLLFDVASDFKIVRVGNAGGAGTGKRGTPENSLSYAAHTAAAARQKEARSRS